MYVISICPNLTGHGGHDLSYARAMGAGLRHADARHAVLLPKTSRVQEGRTDWFAYLPGKGKSTLTARLRYFFSTVAVVRRFLHGVAKSGSLEKTTLFMESFTVLQLFAVLAALIFNRSSPEKLALLFRSDLDLIGSRRGVYRFALFISTRLAGVPVVLMTDSELMNRHLVDVFGQPVFTLPIPHAVLAPQTPDKAHAEPPMVLMASPLVMWWPGSPRPEKGLATLRALFSTWSLAAEVTLLASKLANFTDLDSRGIKLVSLADPLSESEYSAAMQAAHVVLLPYDSKVYKRATSGIFVETVTAGRIPVVSEGTWMASELRNLDLPELVVDWADPKLPEKLMGLRHRPAVMDKLLKARVHYAKYHTEENFGRVLRVALESKELAIG